MEEKSNVSRVKKIQGSYQFRIEGYSGLSSRVGDCVESPEFVLCGHKWQLRIFPGGSLENHKDFASFYLASKSNKLARASYKLIVVNQVIGGEDEVFCSSGIRIFEAKGVQIDGWGRDKFMNSYMLTDPDFGFNSEDSVTFKVEINVYGDLEVTKDSIMTNKIHTMTQCMQKLLHDPIQPDVSLVIGTDEVVIKTHKCILMARSPVFYAMFSNAMNESICGIVMIPDFEYTVINDMLNYIYTDIVPPVSLSTDQISSQNLFKAAVKYQIPGLISIYEEYFIQQMNNDSVLSLLQMADIYGAQHLKLTALQYVAKNASKIIQRKEFNDLDEDLLKDANKLIELVNKRKGCGSVVERERRFNSTCVIA